MVCSEWSGMRAIGVMPKDSAARTMCSTWSRVGGAVLAVDHDEVVAEGAEDLDHVGGVAGDDAAEDDVAFVEFGLGGVGAHGVSPLC